MHLNKSTEHFHALAAQLNDLKSMKEPLSENEILLRDFAKSYIFLVQYEIQGMHWNNQQCSLHPVVVYYHKLDQTQVTLKSSFISRSGKKKIPNQRAN